MTPVIDVHAHVFNAHDIPILGYLRSRRSKSLIETILSWTLARPLLKCVEKDSEDRGFLCNLLLGLASYAVGEGYLAWAETLPEDQIDITSELIDDFANIDLFIPLMIDYQYWFRASRGRQITDIKQQIEHLYKNVIVPFKGRVHPFVAFDPARELANKKGMDRPNGDPEIHSSLALVKDAIENKGFIGVKLYNSLGYKPFDNATVQRLRAKNRVHRKMGYHKQMSGQDYDEVLYALYKWCAENEVPITTHCGMGGIEAYHDASWDFGHPTFWREVLDQPELKDLHLNLAHFGWNYKTGYNGKDLKNRPSWVSQICQMVADYPHLYTDVSHHRVIAFKNRRRFEAEYDKMRQASGTDWPRIKEKILFGIDWHVIKRVQEYERFQPAYEEVMTDGAQYSQSDLENFLGANALRFLGLGPNGQNRRRLTTFYQNHSITPPPWF